MNRVYAYLVCLSLFFFLPQLFAGGGVDDYQRWESLRSRVSNKVYRKSIEPKWFGDEGNFWYKIKTDPDSHEFVLVNADAGTRKRAFDHEVLASALIDAGMKNIKSGSLPLEKLQFDLSANSFKFQVRNKLFEYCLKTNKLITTGIVEEKSLAALTTEISKLKSAPNGKETEITFVNRTQGPVKLLWIDTAGNRHDYGTVEPGSQKRQHTFANHVWLAVDKNGNAISAYRASKNKSKALIGVKNAEKRNTGSRNESRKESRRNLSPDKKWQAFLKDHNVWIRKLDDSTEFKLSEDGREKDKYINRMYWSPDSKKLIALRQAEGENHIVHLIESAPEDQVQPKLHSFKYYKPGDKIDIDRPCLFDIDKKKPVPVSDELFSNPFNLKNYRWSPDSSRFTFIYNQRGHQLLRMVSIDAVTGETSALFEETSETFICYSRKFFCDFVDDSDEIIWMSERDGWNHLYLYDSITGEVKNQITKGHWVVRGIERVDHGKRQVWFTASGLNSDQDPYYIHLCRVNFDGTEMTVLTEGDGTHKFSFSPDRKYFIDNYSRVDLPPVHRLRSADDGKLICELEKADWSELLKTGWQAPERFAAKGRDGKTDIYGNIFRPTNFDSSRSYPVIENIYAGPHSSFVKKSFTEYTRSMQMAELGFIVVRIDGMGTSNRSKAFHDVCWKNLADSGLPDRILWIKAAAKKYPYMDIERVGIFGGSAGGQSSTAAMFTHGDFYKVAVSDCGCHDNRMDKIWWNEQWMGWPVGEHYAENSNVTLAGGLKGKLLLIVGELDRNVDPASTMQVVNALVKADKDFDMLVIPGAGHGAAESKYGNRRRADYFVRHLMGVEPRHN